MKLVYFRKIWIQSKIWNIPNSNAIKTHVYMFTILNTEYQRFYWIHVKLSTLKIIQCDGISDFSAVLLVLVKAMFSFPVMECDNYHLIQLWSQIELHENSHKLYGLEHLNYFIKSLGLHNALVLIKTIGRWIQGIGLNTFDSKTFSMHYHFIKLPNDIFAEKYQRINFVPRVWIRA